MKTHHPQVDLKKWATLFPLESFEAKDGPRQFGSTEPGDPLDLWKARGKIITSPAHLCAVELVRRETANKHDLGSAVPVDIFLWSTAPPQKPYLTKLGGIPHRESNKPWPKNDQGEPYTFVAQFCFLDSKNIVSDRLPGDVLLVFFENEKSVYFGNIEVEWSTIKLEEPATAEICPRAGFPVPELSGVIYRCHEYPESTDVFKQEGHYRYWLFATTQSTKIGRETYFIQQDPRWDDDGIELVCALNSIHPSKEWPFIDCEQLPDERGSSVYSSWGKYRMMFGDVGCLYFFLDGDGKLQWHFDCY